MKKQKINSKNQNLFAHFLQMFFLQSIIHSLRTYTMMLKPLFFMYD